MKSTEKKELSHFRLKLETYLNEHFPEMSGNNPFITARSDEALTAYCDAVAQGFSHPEAESMYGKRSPVSRAAFLPIRYPCFRLGAGVRAGTAVTSSRKTRSDTAKKQGDTKRICQV